MSAAIFDTILELILSQMICQQFIYIDRDYIFIVVYLFIFIIRINQKLIRLTYHLDSFDRKFLKMTSISLV